MQTVGATCSAPELKNYSLHRCKKPKSHVGDHWLKLGKKVFIWKNIEVKK